MFVQVLWGSQPRAFSQVVRAAEQPVPQHTQHPQRHHADAYPGDSLPLHRDRLAHAAARRRGSVSASDVTDGTGRSSVHDNPTFGQASGGNHLDGAAQPRTIAAFDGTVHPSAAHALR